MGAHRLIGHPFRVTVPGQPVAASAPTPDPTASRTPAATKTPTRQETPMPATTGLAVDDYDPKEFKKLPARDRQYAAWASMARMDAQQSRTPQRTAYSPRIVAANARAFPAQVDDYLRAYGDELGVELSKLGPRDAITPEKIALAAGLRKAAPGTVAAAPRPVAVAQSGAPRLAGESGERKLRVGEMARF